MRELELILSGGRVKRYHAKPTLHEETVGHHSFIVAWLVELLSVGLPRAQLLLAALQHDLPECITGDLPAPSKKKFGISEQFSAYEVEILEDYGHQHMAGQLTTEELKLLSLADKLAGIIHCIHERRLGNRYLDRTYGNYVSYVDKEAMPTPRALKLYHHLKGQWNDCK